MRGVARGQAVEQLRGKTLYKSEPNHQPTTSSTPRKGPTHALAPKMNVPPMAYTFGLLKACVLSGEGERRETGRREDGQVIAWALSSTPFSLSVAKRKALHNRALGYDTKATQDARRIRTHSTHSTEAKRGLKGCTGQSHS